jgi:outer membrane protein
MSLRTLSIVLLTLLSLGVSTSSRAESDFKIGFVDTERILREAAGRAGAEETREGIREAQPGA